MTSGESFMSGSGAAEREAGCDRKRRELNLKNPINCKNTLLGNLFTVNGLILFFLFSATTTTPFLACSLLTQLVLHKSTELTSTIDTDLGIYIHIYTNM